MKEYISNFSSSSSYSYQRGKQPEEISSTVEAEFFIAVNIYTGANQNDELTFNFNLFARFNLKN